MRTVGHRRWLPAHAGDGIVLGAAGPITVERGTVTGAGGDGIVARRTHDLLLYDVLAYANADAGLRLGNADAVTRFVTLYANHGAGAHVARGKLVLRDAIVSDNAAAGLACTAKGTAKITDTLFWQNGLDLDPPNIPVGPGARFGERPLRADPGPDGVRGGAGWADDVFTLDTAKP